VVAVERRLVGIHAVEQKRLRIGLVGEPARELERRMQMAIDEAGRRDAVAAADGLPGGMTFRHLVSLADGDDLALMHCHRSVADDAALRIDCDQPVNVIDNEVDALHVYVRLSSIATVATPA